MTREDLIKWAVSKGWVEDSFGHLQKTVKDRRYRLKLQDYTFCKQVRNNGNWIRLRTYTYKDSHIDENNKLVCKERKNKWRTIPEKTS